MKMQKENSCDDDLFISNSFDIYIQVVGGKLAFSSLRGATTGSDAAISNVWLCALTDVCSDA